MEFLVALSACSLQSCTRMRCSSDRSSQPDWIRAAIREPGFPFHCASNPTLLGAAKLGWESAPKSVHCSIAPGRLTGTFRPIVPNATESARPKHTEFSGVRAYSVCGYTSPSRWPCDYFLHVSRTAASLSVEGSRLARRPPRKRRVATFTPRSETTIGTGLNSCER